MSNPGHKATILCFEDEEDVREMLVEFLSKEGYRVIAYPDFPENGVNELDSLLDMPPEFVLMDINMPGMNGYEACRQLRETYSANQTRILFLSGLMEDEDILKAYNVGADDYMVKPFRFKELVIKLEKFSELSNHRKLLDDEVISARKLAFDAMTTSSELGDILRFHEESYNIDDLEGLAKLLMKTISGFSLKSSVMLFNNKTHYFSDDGLYRPIEEKILKAIREQTRIFCWKKLVFFNYSTFSVLIRNMPVDDEERYGVLKDQLCILFNGVDARIKALLTEESNQLKSKTIKITADTIANMVIDMECDKVGLSSEFEKIILKMEDDICRDIVKFNLLEKEEKVLLEHIVKATKESSHIFDSSLEKEKEYKEIMNRLLKELLSNIE